MLNTAQNKKGFTLIEIFIVVSIIAIIGATSISFYVDYIEDAKQTVRNTNVKLVNEALNRYYKEHMVYPKYIWKDDSVEDIKKKINKGLDSTLSSYFSNKKVSEILSEASNSNGYEIYYLVTKPPKKKRVTNDDYQNIDNTVNDAVWKQAKNLRIETIDYLVHEIKIVDSGIYTSTFDDYEKYNFPLITDSTPTSNQASNYNTIPIDDELDIKMVAIPPGTFIMGTPIDELG